MTAALDILGAGARGAVLVAGGAVLVAGSAVLVAGGAVLVADRRWQAPEAT